MHGHRRSTEVRHTADKRRGRRLLGASVIAGVVLAVVPFAAPPAFAARLATASVDRTAGYRGNSYTYSFTVTNTSTSSERIASVVVTRPSSTHTITACPNAPTGWTGAVSSGTYCVYNSSAGTTDDIAAGTNKVFMVTASIAAGTSSVTNQVWGVLGDDNDTFNPNRGMVTMTATGLGTLDASVYGIEITDVVVASANPTAGSPCPAANKQAPAGSSRVLVVCGTNHTNATFVPTVNNSSVTGSFLISGGSIAGGPSPSGAVNVVLGYFGNAQVTLVETAGLGVTVALGSAQASRPPQTLTGFSTYDGTAPAAPSSPDMLATSDSGVSPSDNITGDNTPTVVGTAEANSEVEVIVDGTVKGTTTATAVGAYVVTLDELSEGAKSVSATATDANNNVSPASQALDITVDTVAPEQAIFDSVPENGLNEDPVWSFQGESDVTFDCVLSYPNGAETPIPVCASPRSFDLSSAPDGNYSLKVRQTDPAGNTGPYSTSTYTLDRTPPVPNVSGVTGGGASSSDAVQVLNFSGAPGATFRCKAVGPDGVEIVVDDCVGPHAFDLSGYPDGAYTLSVRQFVGGIGSVPAEIEFVLDRVARTPGLTSLSGAASSNDAPQFSFGGEAGADFDCILVDPAGAESTYDDCATSDAYTLDKGDGIYTFKVRQIDLASNVSPWATVTYALDTIAPAQPEIDVMPKAVSADLTPAFAFDGEDGATFVCTLTAPDGKVTVREACTAPSGFILEKESGAYNFTVTQMDAAGNVSLSSLYNFTIDVTAPKVQGLKVTPTSMKIKKAKLVTISFKRSEASTALVTIKRGRQVVKILKSTKLAKSALTLRWKPTVGKKAPRTGKYTVQVSLTDVFGNRSISKRGLKVSR